MSHNNKMLKTLHDEKAEDHSDLNALDNFVEKYLPFKTLNYIHDSLKACLKGKQFQKLLTYMEPIYLHLEYVTQNDDGKARFAKREFQKPDIQKEIADYQPT